jgi:hypothetical protein
MISIAEVFSMTGAQPVMDMATDEPISLSDIEGEQGCREVLAIRGCRVKNGDAIKVMIGRRKAARE